MERECEGVVFDNDRNIVWARSTNYKLNRNIYNRTYGIGNADKACHIRTVLSSRQTINVREKLHLERKSAPTTCASEHACVRGIPGNVIHATFAMPCQTFQRFDIVSMPYVYHRVCIIQFGQPHSGCIS